MITICVDRALQFFTRRQQSCYQLDLPEPAHLSDALERLGIPMAEVHLVVINGQAFEPGEIVLTSGDTVKLYPPFGGG